MLNPSEPSQLAKALAADTRFLGVVAAYRDLEHAKWRTSVAVLPNQPQKVTVKAGELAVEAAISK